MLIRIQQIAMICLVICVVLFAAFAVLPFKMPLSNTGILADDKFQHFASFFILTTLAAIALPRISLPILIAILTIFGFCVEYIQPVFERSGDTKDALANIAGIAAAWLVFGAASLRGLLKSEAARK